LRLKQDLYVKIVPRYVMYFSWST